MLGLPMLELLPPLNDKNLPWIDVIHPIVVHFVIAMALITVVFDLIGVISGKKNLFEVSFWNLILATVAIFVAIIFGQVEAGLANPYGASRDILNIHSTIGWSTAGSTPSKKWKKTRSRRWCSRLLPMPVGKRH